jgi:hypothetical protein
MQNSEIGRRSETTSGEKKVDKTSYYYSNLYDLDQEKAETTERSENTSPPDSSFSSVPAAPEPLLADISSEDDASEKRKETFGRERPTFTIYSTWPVTEENHKERSRAVSLKTIMPLNSSKVPESNSGISDESCYVSEENIPTRHMVSDLNKTAIPSSAVTNIVSPTTIESNAIGNAPVSQISSTDNTAPASRESINEITKEIEKKHKPLYQGISDPPDVSEYKKWLEIHSKLSDELIMHIQQFLSEKDLWKISVVNKQWRWCAEWFLQKKIPGFVLLKRFTHPNSKNNFFLLEKIFSFKEKVQALAITPLRNQVLAYYDGHGFMLWSPTGCLINFESKIDTNIIEFLNSKRLVTTVAYHPDFRSYDKTYIHLWSLEYDQLNQPQNLTRLTNYSFNGNIRTLIPLPRERIAVCSDSDIYQITILNVKNDTLQIEKVIPEALGCAFFNDSLFFIKNNKIQCCPLEKLKNYKTDSVFIARLPEKYKKYQLTPRICVNGQYIICEGQLVQDSSDECELFLWDNQGNFVKPLKPSKFPSEACDPDLDILSGRYLVASYGSSVLVFDLLTKEKKLIRELHKDNDELPAILIHKKMGVIALNAETQCERGDFTYARRGWTGARLAISLQVPLRNVYVGQFFNNERYLNKDGRLQNVPSSTPVPEKKSKKCNIF